MGISHYKRDAERRPPPQCPRCGQTARESQTRYGLRADCCGLWSWDRWPLVDAETHAARRRAHAAFDPLWQSGALDRASAYARLADTLGIAPAACHIKQMDRSTAEAAALAAVRLAEEIAVSRRGTDTRSVNATDPQSPETSP
jgi:hypothetical protein